MSCLAVSRETLAVSRGLHIDVFRKDQNNVFEVPTTKKHDNDSIGDVTLSSDASLLAAITTLSKELFVFHLPDVNSPKRFSLPRSSSKIRFTKDNKNILVADKSGDALIYDITVDGSSGTKLLGHLSILLDILETDNRKYIITSDRDEKIKISCYPNTYNIHTYCLGHKEFVNHIELLPHNRQKLLSSSGDGTVKLWDIESGKLLYTINTNDDITDKDVCNEFVQKMDVEGIQVTKIPVLHCTVAKCSDKKSFVAVVTHNSKEIILYVLSDDDDIHCELKSRIVLEKPPAAIMFYENNLYVYDNTNSTVYNYKYNDKEFILDSEIVFFKDIQNECINNTVLDYYESVKLLFKRKFDNVQEYQERKKQRLQKKQ